MRLIHFKIEASQEEEHKALNIYIDNENIIEHIKRYEKQFEPQIAGGYEGLNINFLQNIDEHLLGELNENDLFNYDGKTQILGCNCGEPGCWPLLVKIMVNDEIIVWSEFTQPHFTTTVWVINRVHGNTTNCRTNTTPAICTCFTK